MRVVAQRVHRAKVSVEGKITGEIGPGLLVFLGVHRDDDAEALPWLINKLVQVRVFDDQDGNMNVSLKDFGGEILVISQFTLYGNLKKGSRPSFNRSAPPETAVPLYEHFVTELSKALGKPVPTGVFGAHMDIEAHNDGPVTLIIDTAQRDL